MTLKKNSLWHLALILIFALVFFLSLRKIYDTDIGFHLRGGEWMLSNKSFHRYDEFTYTVRGTEYIAMYWLYQIILFTLYHLFNDRAISVFNSILILIFYFFLYKRLRRAQIPDWLISILLFTSIFPLEIRFGPRPEIFTYICMAMMLFILDLFYHDKKNYLYLLPAVQLIWVNSHGLFIIGWGIMLYYLISIYFHEKTRFKDLSKWSLISIALSFLNPYHIKGILFPFYLFTRLQNTSIFKDAITEFASPFSSRGFLLTPHSALFVYFIFLVLSLFLLISTRRKIHEYLLFLSFAYLSSTAVRNIPLFIIVAVPIIGSGIKDLLLRIKISFKYFKLLQNIFAIIIVSFALLFILCVINNGYYALRGGGNFGPGFDPEVQPLKAGEFIVKNNLKGRILNDLNRGSWLIWAVREPVYIDGRLEVIKERLFKEFHDSHKSGGILQLIEKYRPSIVIFDYSYPEALFWDIDLENSEDWRIIYWDETSVIYARNGYAEELKPISFLDVIHQRGLDTDLNEQKVWSILRTPTKSLLKLLFESLYKRQNYPTALIKMAFYASVKLDFQAAEILYLNALKKSDYHRAEIYFRLGLIYHFMQKFDKAEYCYERTLKEKSGHKKAREMLNRLRQRLLPIE